MAHNAMFPSDHFGSPLHTKSCPSRGTERNSKRSVSQAFWEIRCCYSAETPCQVEFLGRGGFGRVVKALNKLDRHFYAIKKIRLPGDPADEAKLLREVTTWSRLSHPCKSSSSQRAFFLDYS